MTKVVAQRRGVFILSRVVTVNKVRYKGGFQSISNNTHTRTLLGHKTSFLRVENMCIFGPKIWTADAQNHIIAARINGNLGHAN
jgi:hypothetical protein